MKTKFSKVILLVVMLALALSGCVFFDEVATNQVAVELYQNEIVAVHGPGVYTRWFCGYCDLKVTDVDTLTFPVEDASVLTEDNQKVGVLIQIQARRKSDDASVKNIFTNYSTYTDPNVMIGVISASAREAIKNGMNTYTLTELLADRDGLATAIQKPLQEDANKFSAEIVNVTITDIAPSDEYMAILGETANIKAETDKEKRRQDLINQQAANQMLEQQQRVRVAEEQLLAEQAETNVQVEIAQREGEIVSASNQVYVDNPQAYELKRLELLKDVLGNNTIYLPSDVVLYLLQGQGSNFIVPAPGGSE